MSLAPNLSSHVTLRAFEEEHSSQQNVWIHGGAYQTCSFQINTSLGYNARIEIPGISVSEEPFSLYVERREDLANCQNRFVVFSRNEDVCNTVFLHGRFKLYLLGNVSILLSVSALEVQQQCPES